MVISTAQSFLRWEQSDVMSLRVTTILYRWRWHVTTWVTYYTGICTGRTLRVKNSKWQMWKKVLLNHKNIPISTWHITAKIKGMSLSFLLVQRTITYWVKHEGSKRKTPKYLFFSIFLLVYRPKHSLQQFVVNFCPLLSSHVSHPYRTADKNIVWNLLFYICECRWWFQAFWGNVPPLFPQIMIPRRRQQHVFQNVGNYWCSVTSNKNRILDCTTVERF